MKTLLLASMTLLLSFQVNAQIFFGPNNPISKPGLAQPRDFNGTDVDGDGDIDAVVVSRGTQELVWLENKNGLGSFGEPNVLVSNVNQPSNSIGADIDSDGDQDIVFAVWGNRKLMWFENLDGQGDFSAPIIIDDYANGIWRVRAADMDGDGDLDLVSAEREGNSILWYENLDGAGNFSEKRVIFDGMTNARDAYPADMDGDGDLDVVTADWYTGIIAWHRNLDGMGNFSDTIVLSNKADDVNRLFCTDFNGDGLIDILCKNRYDLFYLQNVNGGDSFTEKEVSTGNNIFEHVVTDFDGDGDADILVTYYGTGYLGWFKNDGTGKFNNLIPMPNDIGGANSLFVEDINGNSYPDVVIFNYSSSLIIWYDNSDGLGNTAYPKVIYLPEISTPSDMLVVDVDLDGVNELLVASSYGHRLYQYKKENRLGGYGDIKSLPGFIFNPQAMDMGHVTNDNYPDVVACSAYNGEIYLWANQTGGNFGSAVLLGGSNSNTNDVIVVDLDNDGDDDVAAVSYYADKLMIFENTGNGSFGPEIIVSNQLNGASCLNAADLTGDGYPEIMVSATIDDFVAFFENKGDLNFESPKVIDNDMNGTRNVIAADLDNDGDQDLLASAFEKVMRYENLDGAGNFGPGENMFSWEFYGNIKDLKTADADNDGDLDVFVISEDYNLVVWYMNEDHGDNFVAQQSFAEDRYGSETLNFEDVDGDGMTDVLLGSFDDNKVGWYKNENYPVFSTHPVDKTICQSGEVLFTAEANNADNYRWQISPVGNNHFVELVEDEVYSGVFTNELVIDVPSPNWNKHRYRCVNEYLGQEFYSEPATLSVDVYFEATAGDDSETCNSYQNLWGNDPNLGSGQWSVIQGNAVFEDDTTGYTTARELQAGENIFQWTLTNGVCISEDQVSVTKYDSVEVQIPVDSLFYNIDETAEIYIQPYGDILSYQWFRDGNELNDDGRIQNTTTANLIIDGTLAEDSGAYRCLVQGICNDVYSEEIIVDVFTVNTTELADHQILAYPNPVDDFIYLESESLIKSITLLGESGSIIKVVPGIGKKQFSMDVADLPSGIYLMKIKLENGTSLVKFVK